MTSDARYRKINDGSMNSSTYHKKDGTPVRAILKREAEEQIKEQIGDMPKTGQIIEIPLYSSEKVEVRVLKIRKFGTIDVERLSDGKCFRVTGLPLNEEK